MIAVHEPGELARRDYWIATVLGVAISLVALLASSQQGIHRDEAYYMNAGERYIGYYEAAFRGEINPFDTREIERYWAYNSEHPPLFKILYGLSWRLLHRCDCHQEASLHPDITRIEGAPHLTLGLLSEVEAFRLPTCIAFGLLAALLYVFSVQAFSSRLGGVAAALLMAAQPRAFFHAETASFDLPAATLWFVVTYCYWRALAEPGRRFAVATGIFFGLFISTKLQSFFLPFALGAHWLALAGFRRWRKRAAWPAPAPLVSMALFGPLIALLCWPWLWPNPLGRFYRYLRFHWSHVNYDFEYFGRNLEDPPFPWHEPFGMLVTTAPVMLLLLAAAGSFVLMREGLKTLRSDRFADPRATRLLLLIAGLLPLALFTTGTTPVYGATKHWLASMGRLVRFLAVALLAVAVLPGIAETARSHPYGLSHYNALVGGAPGGADLGMNRQFWGYSALGVLPYLNQSMPANGEVYLHDVNRDAYKLYLREGLLRGDTRRVGGWPTPARVRGHDAAIVIHEKHFGWIDYTIWNAYGDVSPSRVLTLDGVPIVSVYEKKKKEEERKKKEKSHRQGTPPEAPDS
ncbi:MAG: glycosyltransferase family 39 protein [Deltaproteobacteria bacterium]|nr:glycosyltransferase family 39 protein [Deltaproteobacteria bacterium]